MTTEIVQSKELTASEQEALFGWDPDPFRSRGDELRWRPKDTHFVLYVDKQPVSHVGLVRETVLVGNTNLQVAGIGDVITVPSCQGRGFAQACLGAAQKLVAEDWRVDYGVLFAFPELARLYGKCGWTEWIYPVRVEQDGGTIVMPRMTMVNTWNQAVWPQGEINIKGLPW